jgi:hypothetical protein
MADAASNPLQQQVNLLLPFPLAEQVGGDVIAALASADRANRRAAIAEIESHDVYLHDANTDLVREIVGRLADVGVAASSRAAVANASSQSGALSLDDLDPSIGPPDDVPLYNPYTGVLTVPSPEGMAMAADAAATVRSEVSDLVEEAEPTPLYRIAAAMDPGRATAMPAATRSPWESPGRPTTARASSTSASQALGASRRSGR